MAVMEDSLDLDTHLDNLALQDQLPATLHQEVKGVLEEHGIIRIHVEVIFPLILQTLGQEVLAYQESLVWQVGVLA